MARFDSGVEFYVTGELIQTINFPEGELKCRWCPMCRKDNDVRHRCSATNRILFSTEFIPPECPIRFESEEPTDETV